MSAGCCWLCMPAGVCLEGLYIPEQLPHHSWAAAAAAAAGVPAVRMLQVQHSLDSLEAVPVEEDLAVDNLPWHTHK